MMQNLRLLNKKLVSLYDVSGIVSIAGRTVS